MGRALFLQMGPWVPQGRVQTLWLRHWPQVENLLRCEARALLQDHIMRSGLPTVGRWVEAGTSQTHP